MTIKLNEETDEACMWAIDILSNLARYTYTQKKFFQPYEYISGGGQSLHIGVESNITALLTISDTEAQTQDTLYGKTEFIQLVGITESELQALINDRDNAYFFLTLSFSEQAKSISSNYSVIGKGERICLGNKSLLTGD